jgi:hypothetical protein
VSETRVIEVRVRVSTNNSDDDERDDLYVRALKLAIQSDAEKLCIALGKDPAEVLVS